MALEHVDLTDFKKKMAKFKKNTVDEFVRRKNKFATDYIKQLIVASPFYTGSYINSHSIGINLINYNFNYLPHGSTSRGEVSASVLARAAAKIKTAGEFDTIYISNSIPHAINVEYTGWEFPGLANAGSIAAYHTYGLTYQAMRMKLAQYFFKGR